MKPLILKYQEKFKPSLPESSLGTRTVTESRENLDDDFENNQFFLGTMTGTATRENKDTDFDN